MKRLFPAAVLMVLAFLTQQASAQTTIKVFDTVLYFDGYAQTVAAPAPPAGVLRLRNDLYSRMLTSQELQSIGSTLSMQVTVKAACDNYDRIGNVNMALVPKGATSYKSDSVPHIELARYITPFMDKNRTPNTVPYTFQVDNVASLLKEASITSKYDIWIELQLFGVPYAANTQIAGCSGRNDVFYGSLDFITNTPAATQNDNVLIPLLFQKNVNNYDAAATDTVGATTKSVAINVPANLKDASLFLITSNHGANAGGEEYNRRIHYAYFDKTLKLTYTPGRTSCEPFRMYNTQGNGIYSPSPRTDAAWQSFSNWCPGDKIDIRRIDLGAVPAGSHSFMLRVPDAIFNGGEGYFPVSLYLQGKTSGGLSVSQLPGSNGISVYPNPAVNTVTIAHQAGIQLKGIRIVNVLGEVVCRQEASGAVTEILSTEKLSTGLYIVQIQTNKGTFMRQLQILR